MFLNDDTWRILNAAMAIVDVALLGMLFPRLWPRWNTGERFTRMATIVILVAIAGRSIQFVVIDFPVDFITASYTAATGWMLWGLVLVHRDMRRGVQYGHVGKHTEEENSDEEAS